MVEAIVLGQDRYSGRSKRLEGYWKGLGVRLPNGRTVAELPSGPLSKPRVKQLTHYVAPLLLGVSALRNTALSSQSPQSFNCRTVTDRS